MTAEQWISLECHPSTRAKAVRAIAVLVRRSSSAELQISFHLDGDISRIHVPARSEARINTELWHHTCFEAFIAIDGDPGYHEINFAPSQEWCVYAF
ncbi:MAG TPA: hypothetical protein VGR40_04200, partial [Candidatus Binatus sp.]|nr:hypothetical protein [Candidatus Binatus sp.]